MYEFIRLMYRMGRMTSGQVLEQVPQHITAEEAEKIISGA